MVIRDRVHYLIIKEYEVISLKIYLSSEEPIKYLKHLRIDLKNDNNSNTLVVGEFNTALSPFNSSINLKNTKDANALTASDQEGRN